MTAKKSTARDRLITGPATGGVTVRLAPEGIAELAAAGNAGDTARVQRLLPKLAQEQRPLVLEQLHAGARAEVLREESSVPRRRGRPAGTSSTSPVALLRDHEQVTQVELATRLGVTDGAVRGAERRGFAIGLDTLAEYAASVGATVDVVLTHADGTQARIPVPRDRAA